MQGNDYSRTVNITGDVTGSTINLGEISGQVSNQINELPPPATPDQPDLKAPLTQLKTAIETDSELADEDKAEALSELKVIAEAGRQPQEGALQKAAKRAMTMLKGIATGLSETTKLATTLEQVLPVLAGFFGL